MTTGGPNLDELQRWMLGAITDAAVGASAGDGRSPPTRSSSAKAAIVWSASRGHTASAPKPSRHATWCTSRGSSLSTSSVASVRNPALTR